MVDSDRLVIGNYQGIEDDETRTDGRSAAEC